MKKLAFVLAGAALVAGGLYQFAGLRVTLDGSGWLPRFVSTTPDYDALDADRARQRQSLAVPRSGDTAPPIPAPSVSSPADGHIPATVTGATTPPTRPAEDAEASAVSAAPVVTPVSDRETARSNSASRGRWTDFRGPARDGRYPGPVRTAWPSGGLPVLWKQPVGLGYASFVAADGRAFTIEQRRGNEVVAAYDLDTGREVWTNAWAGMFVEGMGGDGPRATPTYHDGRIYALGALGELRCLDAATGAVIWRRNILADASATNLSWGMASAPLIVGDTIIVLPGGSGGRSVAAYDRLTGAPAWTALDDRQAYVSPMLATLAGRTQLVVVSATRVVGLTPSDGALLWEYPWATDMGINAAQPLVISGSRLFVSAGYGQGAAVFEVTQTGGAFATRTIWRNTRMKNKFTSSVLHDGFIYGLDESILTCLDAATGEMKWKGGRYGYGQTLLAGDHLIVLTEEGELALVAATPDRHVELARVPAIAGKTWNHPIVVDGRLLVRNLREMAAFDIRP